MYQLFQLMKKLFLQKLKIIVHKKYFSTYPLLVYAFSFFSIFLKITYSNSNNNVVIRT
jgi:hypothetical protein